MATTVPTHTSIALTQAPPVRLVVTTAETATPTATQRVEYALHSCASATCHCCDLTLVEVETASAATATADTRTGKEFLFDVFAKTVTPVVERASATAERMATTLAAAMSPAIAAQLAAHFFAAKARAFETFDGTSDAAAFPFEEVERDGTLVPLRQVVPFAPRLASPVTGDRDLLVDEQYCVDTRCDCTRTVVGVVALAQGHSSAVHRDAVRVVDFLVDWQRERWTVADRDRPLSPTEVTLRDGLLAANPDLFAVLRRRHRMMRTLYVTSAAKAGRPAFRPVADRRAPRVGRNDPCPCGSGKKSKRCCQSTDGTRT